MRRAPSYHPDAILARVVLDPNGDHRLEVETTGGIMIASYDANTVPELERAIEQFKSVTVRADGGPDFHNRKVVSLEVSR